MGDLPLTSTTKDEEIHKLRDQIADLTLQRDFLLAQCAAGEIAFKSEDSEPLAEAWRALPDSVRTMIDKAVERMSEDHPNWVKEAPGMPEGKAMLSCDITTPVRVIDYRSKHIDECEAWNRAPDMIGADELQTYLFCNMSHDPVDGGIKLFWKDNKLGKIVICARDMFNYTEVVSVDLTKGE